MKFLGSISDPKDLVTKEFVEGLIEKTAGLTCEIITSGIWTIRKWSNGVAECWGQVSKTVSISTASGVTGMLALGNALGADFPSSLFIETPRCFSKYHGIKSGSTVYASLDYVSSDALTKTHTHNISILRIGGSVSNVTAKADFYAIGKWK